MDGQASKSTLLIFVGQLLVVGAVLLGTWVLHNDLQTLAERPAPTGGGGAADAVEARPAEREQQPQEFDDWQALVSDHNPTYGNEDAPVTIIEFSDFECPFCARHYNQTHAQLLTEYGDQIKLVFKHFPLERLHPNARKAAIAAQCAHRQGKFWPLHDKIFENYRNITDENLLSWGDELGLGDAYASCVRNRETEAQVEQDMQAGRKAGVRGTPTFLVNGKILPGALPFQQFKQRIDSLL